LDIRNILNILEARGEKKKKEKIKIFAIPNEVEFYSGVKEKIRSIFNLDAEILSIKEASKTGKTIKASPSKPGIFIE
jgi:hypothetical protein